MNIINIEHLTHSFTERLLFDDVSFYLSDKDKVGVIGINGTGKSTLLKIIAGKETADRADIIMQRDLRIAYLPQIPEFADTHTTLSGALPLTEEISDQPENYIPQAKSMLHQLGFTRYDQPITELSGGQRKRIALVRTLLTPADVLILDEPTNHLDSAMAEWLEKTLRAESRPLIMITHDRYFLDSVTNAIVEIDKSKLYRYEGNYLYYLEHKAMREEIARATERKRQSILRVEIEWMKRSARARSTKQKAHIARYEALRDMDAPVTDDTVTISSVSSRLGRTTIELDHISKAYEDAVLMQDFTYTFLRDDRIGIIGPNGCGKSTLLKIILGEITPRHHWTNCKNRLFLTRKYRNGSLSARDRLCKRRWRACTNCRWNDQRFSYVGTFPLSKRSTIHQDCKIIRWRTSKTVSAPHFDGGT